MKTAMSQSSHLISAIFSNHVEKSPQGSQLKVAFYKLTFADPSRHNRRVLIKQLLAVNGICDKRVQAM